VAKEKKKWFWPTVRVGLPIAIVAAGAVFVVLAVIFKLMDAESARYLLSAIVQSLAALLAIIFAGVAILWGQEENSIRELGELRFKVLSELFEKEKQNQKGIVGFVKFCLATYKSLDERDRETWRPNMKSLLSIFYIGVNLGTTRLLKFIKRPYEYEEILEEIESNFTKKDIENFSGGSIYLSSSVGLFDFFDAVFEAGFLFIYLVSKCNIAVDKPATTVDRYTSSDVAQSVFVDTFQARVLMAKVKRSQRARGPWFKALISLYSITIAGGMVFLSVLKAGICESQATWIAAFPLGFGICAVALTFVYLARIVSGEKE